MSGQHVGYARVSTFEQNPERQLDQVVVDVTFTDKASGKHTQRPQRNLADLRRLVQTLTKRGVRIEL